MHDQKCESCGKVLKSKGALKDRSYQLSRLFSKPQTLCFRCWEERLNTNARLQQNMLIGLVICNLSLAVILLFLDSRSNSIMFSIIGACILVAYGANVWIHKTIQKDLERLKERQASEH